MTEKFIFFTFNNMSEYVKHVMGCEVEAQNELCDKEHIIKDDCLLIISPNTSLKDLYENGNDINKKNKKFKIYFYSNKFYYFAQEGIKDISEEDIKQIFKFDNTNERIKKICEQILNNSHNYAEVLKLMRRSFECCEFMNYYEHYIYMTDDRFNKLLKNTFSLKAPYVINGFDIFRDVYYIYKTNMDILDEMNAIMMNKINNTTLFKNIIKSHINECTKIINLITDKINLTDKDKDYIEYLKDRIDKISRTNGINILSFYGFDIAKLFKIKFSDYFILIEPVINEIEEIKGLSPVYVDAKIKQPIAHKKKYAYDAKNKKYIVVNRQGSHIGYCSTKTGRFSLSTPCYVFDTKRAIENIEQNAALISIQLINMGFDYSKPLNIITLNKINIYLTVE